MSPWRLKARKYLTAASVALRERTAYRGSFLSSALAYGLFVFVFSRVWDSAYQGRAYIEGYARAQMIWYFIVAELPGFVFAGAFWTLSQDMKSGQVAYLVSRPYDFALYSYAQHLGKAAANCPILLAEGLAIGLATAGAPPLFSGPDAAARGAAALAALFLAGSVFFFLNLALALTALWVEENSAFFWIFQKLMLVVGTLVPLELLPAPARAAAWWTPFPALSYVPARLFAAWPGGPAAGRLLGFQLAWLAAAALGCEAIYAAGRRRLSVNGG
jgi:ABC-2 type transport system permease protein